MTHTEYMRGWRERNRAKVRAADHRYYQRHGEQVRAKVKAYVRRRRPWVGIEGAAAKCAVEGNQRAQRFGCEGWLSKAAVLTLVGECVYCGNPQTGWDHVVALSRGGPHTLDNLVPSCARCNKSKSVRTPDEWLAAGLYGLGVSYR